MSYAIEKGIPIPPPKNGRKPKYPLMDLEIGDSFFVPLTDASEDAIRNASGMVTKRCGRRFAARREEQGIRVWRTA